MLGKYLLVVSGAEKLKSFNSLCPHWHVNSARSFALPVHGTTHREKNVIKNVYIISQPE